MKQNETFHQDEGLIGNEKIEQAILALQQEPTPELLAHALTMVRRRMQENGQLTGVRSRRSIGRLVIGTVCDTSDGKQWWMAFTGFEEELKGSSSVMSTFLVDISKLLSMAQHAGDIEGIILNPWNRTLMLDQSLIRIILGEK